MAEMGLFQSLYDGANKSMHSPMFQMGLGMLGGGGIQGGQKGMQLGLDAEKQLEEQQRRKAQELAWKQFAQQPGAMPGVTPEVARMLQVMQPQQGLDFVGGLASAKAKSGFEVDQRKTLMPMELDQKLKILQAQSDAEFRGTIRTTGWKEANDKNYMMDLAIKKRDLETPPNRTQIVPEGASVLATDPRAPGGARVIYSGAPKQDSATKKAIWEAEDKLPELEGNISALLKAKELNEKAYTGMGAAARGQVMAKLPFGIGATPEAKATVEYGQLMNQQAIEAMSRTLKGATTDKEMGKFLEIIGDMSLPVEQRTHAIDRLLTMSRRHQQLNEGRVQELRGGRMGPAGAGAGGPAGGGTTPQPKVEARKQLPNGAWAVKVEGKWYQTDGEHP